MRTSPSADVVMVGLVPPPYHGQSIMTQALFDSDLSPLRVEVVALRFNKEIDEVSVFRWGKLTELCRAIWKTVAVQQRSRAEVLYYTPGSAKWVPFLKDVVLLTAVRPFFKRTLLHYHSGGLPEFLERRWWSRMLGRWAYGRKAWALALTPEVAVPGEDFGAARELALPNGIIDAPVFRKTGKERRPEQVFHSVFLGNLYREKGILDALEAMILASSEQPDSLYRFSVAGGTPDERVKREFEKRLENLPSNLEVRSLGRVDAAEKWRLLIDSDVMLFPSFYGSENYPLVLLEAMACGLPVIATRWRGIPSIVDSETNGFLADVGDVKCMALALNRLAEEPDLYREMSAAARRKFVDRYDWPPFLERVRTCFFEALSSSDERSSIDSNL